MERKRQRESGGLNLIHFFNNVALSCVLPSPSPFFITGAPSSSGSGGGRPQNAISSGTKVHRCVPLPRRWLTRFHPNSFFPEVCRPPFLFRDRDIILGYYGMYERRGNFHNSSDWRMDVDS